MTHTTLFVGIDIAKHTFVAALAGAANPRPRTFANTVAGCNRLGNWLSKQPTAAVHVCLEATGRYWETVANYCYRQNIAVSVINPARTKAYAKAKQLRNRTDPVDAALLADFVATQWQKLDLWRPRSQTHEQLRVLHRRIQDLQDQRTQEKNRLQAGLTDPFVLADIQAHIDFLDARIRQLTQGMAALIAQDALLETQVALLETIPGIARTTAIALVAELPPIAWFSSAKQVAAYVGLTPNQHTSGTSVRKYSPITKAGPALIRKLLYWPTISAIHHNPAVAAFNSRLQAAGKHKAVARIASMRKLIHIVFGVLNSGIPFNPDLVMPPQLAS